MKKQITLLFCLVAVVAVCFAQSDTAKTLYRGGVYGQTFELAEYTDGNRCRLLLYLSDNGTKQTKTYDDSMPTVYYIWSKWFDAPSEYATAIEASKHFFAVSMNVIYLAELKDICDIAPCCKPLDYRIAKTKDNRKYISIAYDCSDLALLFKIAEVYNHKGRDYVLQNYVN